MVYFIEMQITISSDDDMKQLGERLATALRGGDCIELVGDIGSGKTTLTKGIARGLGIADTVQSPTFTINRTYESPSGLRLSHYDFYRLSDPGIMTDELSEALDDSNTIIVIEWGGVVESILPDDSIRISFESPSETERVLRIAAPERSTERLQEVIA